MTDDTWDETSIASGFVAWYTEPRAYGSYTPLMEEEATRIFFDWLRKVKADTLREFAKTLDTYSGTVLNADSAANMARVTANGIEGVSR